MKKNILKIWTALLAVTLGSCLDDSKYALDPSGSNNTIEFLQPSVPSSPFGSIYPSYTEAFQVTPEATFQRTISFSGAQAMNDQDINLTLIADQTALNEFNEQQTNGLNGQPALGGGIYDMLPADHYSFPSSTTIPKGQKTVEVTITIYPEKFDLSKTYALPIRIASASSGILSAHFSVGIFAVVVKNKFDGEYKIISGTMLETTNPLFVGYYPKKSIYLQTVNANTVNYYDNEQSLAGHIFYTGTGLSYWGGFVAQFKIDETTGDVLSVVNALGQGNNNRSGFLDPTGINKFTFEADGVTPKTMEVKYGFK